MEVLMDNEISLLNLAFLLKLTAVIGMLAAISCVLALVIVG